MLSSTMTKSYVWRTLLRKMLLMMMTMIALLSMAGFLVVTTWMQQHQQQHQRQWPFSRSAKWRSHQNLHIQQEQHQQHMHNPPTTTTTTGTTRNSLHAHAHYTKPPQLQLRHLTRQYDDHHHDDDGKKNVIQCVTHQVTDDDEHASKRAIEWANFLRRQQQQSSTGTNNVNEGGDISLHQVVSTTTTASLQDSNRRIIPVCFHIPQPFGGLQGWITNLFRSDYLSNDKLQRELDHLNEAFSANSCCNPTRQKWCKETTTPCSPAGDTSFEFVMAKVDENGRIVGTTTTADRSTNDPAACITRPFGREYLQLTYGSASEVFVKSSLHVGDASVLNVYYMAAFLNDADNSPMLGFATWPWLAATTEIYMDGVVIDPKTQSGKNSFMDRFDEGDTLVHEVGHWLGLFHTFEKGCHEINDGIADTPKQAFPSYGCDPESVWDSCPHDEGLDAIHNFMGYNDDVCLYQWTPGQAEAMRANYDAYRRPNPGRSIASPPVFLYDGIPLTPQSVLLQELWIFSLQGLYNHETGVTCTTSADTGDVDLFMNWDASLQDFLCISDSPDSSEKCSIVVTDATQIETTAFAMVFGASAASNVTITCTTEGFV